MEVVQEGTPIFREGVPMSGAARSNSLHHSLQFRICSGEDFDDIRRKLGDTQGRVGVGVGIGVGCS